MLWIGEVIGVDDNGEDGQGYRLALNTSSLLLELRCPTGEPPDLWSAVEVDVRRLDVEGGRITPKMRPPSCLLYTSPSPRDRTRSRMPSSA